MGQFSFSKSQRLASEKTIQELFQKGSSFYLYPFRIIFQPHVTDHPAHHQVLLSVSSRNFKKAVNRNKIKRRMREGYRLHQQLLTGEKKYLIAYIYTAREILPSAEIHRKMIQSFVKLKSAHEKEA